jgi:glycosyltransferase involved in cell wall biosynthesis
VVGPLKVDPDYAARVLRAADDRVRVRGPLRGPDLAAVWARIDLLVHAARSETYGLVVAEALAHGVPSLVPSGTGAEEALGHWGAGAAYEPDRMAEWLTRWRGDPGLRSRWRAAARNAREHLPGWERTAERVRSVLDRLRG